MCMLQKWKGVWFCSRWLLQNWPERQLIVNYLRGSASSYDVVCKQLFCIMWMNSCTYQIKCRFVAEFARMASDSELLPRFRTAELLHEDPWGQSEGGGEAAIRGPDTQSGQGLRQRQPQPQTWHGQFGANMPRPGYCRFCTAVQSTSVIMSPLVTEWCYIRDF